ncbi:uncharacterized protein LOC144101715 isoform X1 [Amblyomma americanum]
MVPLQNLSPIIDSSALVAREILEASHDAQPGVYLLRGRELHDSYAGGGFDKGSMETTFCGLSIKMIEVSADSSLSGMSAHVVALARQVRFRRCGPAPDIPGPCVGKPAPFSVLQRESTGSQHGSPSTCFVKAYVQHSAV